MFYTYFRLTARERKSLAVLVSIVALTGSRVDAVQAADATSTDSMVQFQTAEMAPDDVPESRMGLIVPPSYLGKLEPAKNVPATRELRVSMTAYNSEVGQCDDDPFTTANGTRVRDGIIAANFLKFNTRVRIPELYGDKIFTVTDRMNARFGERVDVWMKDHRQAVKFGVKRNIKIEVL